jgi:hypothetical protein
MGMVVYYLGNLFMTMRLLVYFNDKEIQNQKDGLFGFVIEYQDLYYWNFLFNIIIMLTGVIMSTLVIFYVAVYQEIMKKRMTAMFFIGVGQVYYGFLLVISVGNFLNVLTTLFTDQPGFFFHFFKSFIAVWLYISFRKTMYLCRKELEMIDSLEQRQEQEEEQAVDDEESRWRSSSLMQNED